MDGALGIKDMFFEEEGRYGDEFGNESNLCPFVIDAVQLYAYALKKSIEDGRDFKNAETLNDIIR